MNAMVTGANVCFYPEVTEKQIELAIQMERGNALVRMPDDLESWQRIRDVFDASSINELYGHYCRVEMDESTGRIDSVRNILYDGRLEIQDNPVI